MEMSNMKKQDIVVPNDGINYDVVDDVLHKKREKDKARINKELKKARSSNINENEDSYVSNGTLDPLRAKILKEVVEPTYYNDVESAAKSRGFMKSVGDVIEVIAQLLYIASILVAFAVPSFDIPWLGYLAGGLGVGYKALIQLAIFFHKESEERTKTVNGVLSHLNMKLIPNLYSNITIPGTNNPNPNNIDVNNIDLEAGNVKDFIAKLDVDEEKE